LHRFGAGGDVIHLRAQLPCHATLLERDQQQTMQISARHRGVSSAVTRHHGGAQWQATDQVGIEGVAHFQALRESRHLSERGAQAHRLQHMHHVGPELNARPHFR
jgi:hypothetical protein